MGLLIAIPIITILIVLLGGLIGVITYGFYLGGGPKEAALILLLMTAAMWVFGDHGKREKMITTVTVWIVAAITFVLLAIKM